MQNFLNPINFRVAIKRLEGMSFTTKRATIPGISIPSVKTPTPFNKVSRFGDEIEYTNLSLTFLVDEDLSNYLAIRDWIIGGGAPEEGTQHKNLEASEHGLYSDISIVILNSNKRPIAEATFLNCFPIDLSEIALDTSAQSIEYAESSVTFEYDTYSIKKI